MKDSRVQDFFHDFRERNFPVALLEGTWFLQLVLISSQAKEQMRYEMKVPKEFEIQLYFHAMAVLS